MLRVKEASDLYNEARQPVWDRIAEECTKAEAAAGTLPEGLSLEAGTGAIGGTPSASGSSTFTVEVTSAGETASRELTIEVAPEAPLGPNLFVSSVHLNQGNQSFDGHNRQVGAQRLHGLDGQVWGNYEAKQCANQGGGYHTDSLGKRKLCGQAVT
jgi:hypothetical protein